MESKNEQRPMIRGGQGRSARDVELVGWTVSAIFVLALIVVLLLLLGVNG